MIEERRLCLQCYKPIERKENERNDSYEKRVCCDRFCSARRNAVLKSKTKKRGNFFGNKCNGLPWR